MCVPDLACDIFRYCNGLNIQNFNQPVLKEATFKPSFFAATLPSTEADDQVGAQYGVGYAEAGQFSCLHPTMYHKRCPAVSFPTAQHGSHPSLFPEVLVCFFRETAILR